MFNRLPVLKGLIAVLFAVLASAPAHAQVYPSRPITIVVTVSAGGVADLVARLVAARMQETMGQPVVVDNRPGAGGRTSIAGVAKAAPDGYTLLLAPSPFTIWPSLNKGLPWHPLKDFVPVGLVSEVPSVIAVSTANPSRSLAELVARLKEQPDKYSYGSPGVGSVVDLGVRLLAQRAGLKVVHVPYKGQSDALIGLIRGDIEFMGLNVASAQAQPNDVRPLAVMSKDRSAAFPNLPTVAESGFPGYGVTTYYGLVAPVGTDSAIVDRLSKELQAAVQDPDVSRKLAVAGAEVNMQLTVPAAFGSFLADDFQTWKQVIESAGISVQ